jgi:3-hydroxyacyl-[acyl-carrier-protein] dehydratase
LELPANPLEHAHAIFQGIITHYVEPELRPRLRESSDELRLVEDLGLDSLSMVEVMMRVEDLLQIHVSDAELRHFRTLGEVRRFIDSTARRMVAASGVVPAS